MSLHFYPLTIEEVRKETNDCVSIVLQVPENLKETFAYTPGQNVTIRTTINGEEIRRSYSLCSVPSSNIWRIAVKQMENGIFSTYANLRLKKGDVLDVMPPIGKFSPNLQSAHKKNYIAFAAGSGITPILSIITAVLQEEPQSSFTLVYGNRNRQSIVFKEELEALKDKYITRFRVVHVLSRERTDADINFGRIDKKKLAELTKLTDLKSFDEYFLCGPEAMLFCVKDFLEENNVDKKKIHFELFTPATKPTIQTSKHQLESSHSPQSKITVKLDGRSFDFDLGFNSSSILDAALQQGADLPYACKGGVCCTCRAKLIEGEVTMDTNYGLENEEIEQGFILTCQSHPITEKVVVDFDR
jgi:ring-1,2-phenylacetyl-CoA epoxidase subunit PaaE